MSVPLSSSSSMNKVVAEERLELLNLTFPVPGSVLAVSVRKP
jgi:hypothetical protein